MDEEEMGVWLLASFLLRFSKVTWGKTLSALICYWAVGGTIVVCSAGRVTGPGTLVPLLGSLSMNQDQSADPISINLAGSSSFTTGEGLVR